MKKRIICSVMAAMMVLAAVTGCGGSGSEGSTKAEQSSGGGTQDAAEDSSSEAEDAAEEESEDSALLPEISFESFAAVDNDECSIIIKSLEPDGVLGYAVSVELENKSSEKTYMFSSVSAAVNGVETDPLFVSEVAPGKKSVDNIRFMDSTLEENGVGDFTDIEITFRVYDSNDLLADSAARETVHIYPYGEENASVFEREPQETDIVLADDDNITFIVTGYEMDSIFGYAVKTYMVNRTDAEVMFSTDESSVNGYMSDPFWAKSVSAGKCAFSDMHWSKSSLEEIGITDPENEVENIEFILKARNSDDYLADPYLEQLFTLEP